MALQSKLTVYRGFVGTNCYAWSPFVTKLETRLRIAGVKYVIDPGDVRKAPRGKIPYVSMEGSPEKLGDSTLITRNFVELGYIHDLNANLTPVQQAQDLAIRALVEDKMYFYSVRERWVDNYYVLRDGILSAVPYPIRVLLGAYLYRVVTGTLQGQGVLRFTDEEVTSFRVEGWEALSNLLAESRAKSTAASKNSTTPFWVLGGEAPTEADPTVFGAIISCLACPAAPASTKIIKTFPVLVEYARRIHDLYFSEYDLWE